MCTDPQKLDFFCPTFGVRFNDRLYFTKIKKNYEKRIDNTRISVYNIIKDKESEKIKDDGKNQKNCVDKK